MEEWNAIDLHMHTVSGITRDKTTDNVVFSYCYFQDVLKKYNIKLMAVTNHNIIDLQNYVLMKYLAKINKTNILLGVELDTNLFEGTDIHIATIFNEDFKKNFEAYLEINKKTYEKIKLDEVCFDSNEIINILKEYNVLMIPHGNKDKGVFKNASEEKINEALKKVREGFIRIFDSPSDWKLEKVKSFLLEIKEENLDEFGGVLFSDVRDWSKYSEKYREFFMNAEPTFKGLIHSTTNPTKRFRPINEVKKNNNYISKIVLKSKNNNSRIIDIELRLSSAYNCIIGKSGSGKSLLLHMIKKKLLRENKDDFNYSFSDDTEIELYNENDKILDASNINLGIGEKIYEKIIAASAKEDNKDFYEIIEMLSDKFIREEKFNKFKMDYNKKILNYISLKDKIESNKKIFTQKKNKLITEVKRLNELGEIKIFDIKNIDETEKSTYSENDIEDFSKYEEDINLLKERIKKYSGKYLEKLNDEIKKLSEILKLSELDMKCHKYIEDIKKNKVKIVNEAIEKINNQKSTNAKEKAKLIKSIPMLRNEIVGIIIENYISNVQKNSINLSINVKEINSEKIINKSKNVVVIEDLSKKILENINEKDNELFDTYGKKGELNKEKMYNMSIQQDAKKLIDKYIELNILNIDNYVISDKFKTKLKIEFDGQDIREMNPGNIAKKYIEIYFSEKVREGENNVVLFDQIENDVDKKFINDVIKSLIEETKGYVQLIIVTHDPIVAVNADPNNYIESQKNSENKFEYRDFVVESSIKNELDTIAYNVDGSKDVIKGRYEIYKGENIYEN